MTFPTPGVTPGNWGQQLLDELQPMKDRVPSGIKSGNWTFQSGSTATTQALAVGNTVFSPIIVGSSFTAQTVQAEVTTAGGAGCLLRLGLYGVGTNGLPGAVLFDWGTVAATSIAVAPITISAVIPAGYLFLALAVQGTFTGNPTLRAIGGISPQFPAPQFSIWPSNSLGLGYFTGPITGAFTASPAGVDLSDPVARIALRAA